MQLQTNKLYSRGLPSAKPRPTFRPRKHVSVQTGPIQEPQSRPLTRTKGKIFINNRYKHHPVQHQPYQTSEASPGGLRPLGESPRNKSRRNSNTVASSRWSRGSSTDIIISPSGVFPCQGFSWNSNHAFVPRPVGLCFIAARWGGRSLVRSLHSPGGLFDSHAHYKQLKSPLWVPWWPSSG